MKKNKSMEEKILGILVIFFILLINTRNSVKANLDDEYRTNLMSDLINANKAINTVAIVGYFDADIMSSVFKRTSTLSITYEKSPLMLNKTFETAWAHRKLYVTDLERNSDLLHDFFAMDKYFLEHPFHWLLFVTENHIPLFKNASILLASNVVLAYRNVQMEFKLIQVYKVRNSSETLRIESFGKWNNETGLVDQRSSSIIARRRKNFHKELLLINTAMLFKDSFQYLYTYKGKEHDTAVRVCLNQMNIIIDSLNGTNKFMLTEKIGYDGK